MGSWGDLFPVIGLAKATAARGHRVGIATTPAYASLVDGEGLPFTEAGPRFGPEEFAADPKILDGRLGGYAGFLHLFRTVVFPNLVSWVDHLRGSLAGADLLVPQPALLAGPIAAQLAATRWATFSVFPGLIPSAHTLPTPLRDRFTDGPVSRSIHRGAWRLARLNIRRSFDPPVNAARTAYGLAPVRDAFFHPVESGNPYLVGASRSVIKVPPDWPPNVRLTGFFTWDSPDSYRPRDELYRFFDDGAPPILITLGGSSAVDPQRFYPSAVAATERLGHRALVLTGPTPGPASLKPSAGTCVLPFAPLSKVAPRCLACIHHGGIGTTVALLAAGLPQLLVPRSFDQPHTALHMRDLGVARS